MTTATLTAFRGLAETMSRPQETKTAREMALVSHDLCPDGSTAKTQDGRYWLWNNNRQLWVS